MERRTPFDRIGDWIAAALAVALVFLGFTTDGIVALDATRSWVFQGCGVLGLWAVVGLARGRWQGNDVMMARRVLLAWFVFVAYLGAQLIPLPAALATTLSPGWAEAVAVMRESGLTPPAWMPVALAPERGLELWFQALASGLFFAGVLLVASTPRPALALTIALALISILVSLNGLVSFVISTRSLRAQMPMVNPNHQAAAILMGLPVIVGLLVTWRRRIAREQGLEAGLLPDRAMPILGLAVAAMIGWLVTFSRGSLFVGIAVLSAWVALEIFINMRTVDSRTVLAEMRDRMGLLVVGAGLLVALGLFGGIVDGISGRLTNQEGAGAGSRYDIGMASLKGLARSPIFGLGPGSAEAAITRYSSFPSELTPIYSHSDWLQLVVESGIVGSALIFGAILWALLGLRHYHGSRLRRFDSPRGILWRSAGAGLLTAALHAFSDFHLRIPMVGFMALILTALVFSPGARYR